MSRLAPEAMFPAGDPRFRVRYVRVRSGVQLRVVECGAETASEVAVCVHGWACSVYSFHTVLPRLADAGMRAVAIEMPGHGLSEKPDDDALYTLDAMTECVVQVLDTLGIVQATVIGHSMGGAIAARLAARWPERVRRVVLAAPVGFGDAWPLRVALALTPRMMNPVLPYLAPRWIVPLVLRMAFGTIRAPTMQDRDEYWAPTQFPAYTRAMRAVLHAFDWLAGERSDHSGFMAIQAPVTLLYGDRDHFVVQQAARRYADIVPDVRLVLIPGCGHVVPEEVPDAVVEAARGIGVTFSN